MTFPMAVACALLVSGAAGPDRIETVRFELPNGIRAMVVHVADAPRQTVFCHLPVHLANDGPDQPQRSHLLEHMMIRSTDPDALNPRGMLVNGETMHHAMRLEAIAEPQRWREAVDRVATWIAAREFDEAILEREKLAIAGEEQTTAARGFTSKWAIAAWNQAVRHGCDHVALHGSVAEVTLDAVERCAHSLLPIDDRVLIATIGPADPVEVRAAIEASFGTMKRAHAEPAPARSRPFDSQRNFSATWDLPATHVLVWWRLPDTDPATRAAASIVSSNLMMHISGSGIEMRDRERTLVFDHVPTPEGEFFIVDTTVTDGEPSAEKAAARAREALATIREKPAAISITGPMIANSLQLSPDFAAIRGRFPGGRADLAEAQWLLSTTTLEYTWNQPADRVLAALAACDSGAVARLAGALVEQPHGTLILTPRAERK